MLDISWTQHEDVKASKSSSHLLELKREIELEEDEIFGNINQLITSSHQNQQSTTDHPIQHRPHPFSQPPQQYPQPPQQYPKPPTSPLTVAISPSLFDHHNNKTHYYSTSASTTLSSSIAGTTFSHSPCIAPTTSITPPQATTPIASFDANLNEDLQAAILEVTSNLPKPCVFFLEGNCRRSDCKFSHDLSTITCKYWIEGFCFKGELCPFLHSFNLPIGENEDISSSNKSLFEVSKKELLPKFIIESEADFPSLPLPL